MSEPIEAINDTHAKLPIIYLSLHVLFFFIYCSLERGFSLTLSQNFFAQKKKIKIACLSLKYRYKTQLPFSASSIVWDCLLFSSPNKSQKHPQRFHKCLHNILRASKFYLGPITFLELPLQFIWCPPW